MKKLFISTLFPSNNGSSNTISASSGIPSSKSLPKTNDEFVAQTLNNNNISDKTLLDLVDHTPNFSFQRLAKELSINYLHLCDYYHHIKAKQEHAGSMFISSGSLASVGSFIRENYFDDSDDDDSHTFYSSSSSSTFQPISPNSSSGLKPIIDDNYFHGTSPVASPLKKRGGDVNVQESPEQKAQEELQSIIGIIQDKDEAITKSALVAAFRKLNDEGRLPSTPLNITSPIRSSPSPVILFKSVISDDGDSPSLSSVVDLDGMLRAASTSSFYSRTSSTSPCFF